MPRYKTVGFDQDIIDEALAETGLQTVLVFPTKRSAGTAERRNYPDWQFEELIFTSMDELKETLILPPAPLLQEDKRLLCLYRCLTSENREFFHINEYADIISWGQQFFRFFDDLAEELIDPLSLGGLADSGSFYLQNWQELHIEQILGIRERYVKLVQELGFTDKIFVSLETDLKIPWRGYKLVFVNQYYYSALERELIHALENSGNSVLIVWQGPSASFDFEALKARDLRLEDVFETDEFRAEAVDIIETDNPDQMIMDFLSYSKNLESGPNRALLDASYTGKYYSKLINHKVLNPGTKQKLSESFAFQLLLNIREDLKSQRGSFKQAFIPIQNLLDHLADQRFARYFCGDAFPAVRDDLLHLAAKDFIYLDLELNFFDLYTDGHDFSALQSFLCSYFGLLKTFTELGSIDELCDLFNGKLPLSSLLSEDEKQYSDAPVKVYERLANFRSLSTIGLISDPGELFGASSLEQAIGLLELLLQSLQTATFRWQMASREESLFELSNLLDSRNLSFDETVWFHCNEGMLPSNPEPVWLLNETQRKLLGLKTYEDIRRWERYYFYRLLLVSKQSRLYCYRIPEQDVEPGSFITELQEISARSGYIGPAVSTSKPKASLQLIYRNLQQLSGAGQTLDQNSFGFNKKNPEHFFVIPCDPETDFGADHNLNSSYYKLKQMLESPYLWYIRFLKGLSEPVTQIRETLTRKVFGSVIHSYLSLLLGMVSGSHKSSAELDKRLQDRDFLWLQLSTLLEDPLYRYKLPQNYNWDFLKDIIADCIIDTIQWFFRDYLPVLVQDQAFTLIPETDTMTEEEQKPRKLLELDYQGQSYSLCIRGKVDLRIETAGENFIIDFKTGEGKKEQLIIYEWVYYLLLDALGDKSLSSHICQILEQESEPMNITDKQRETYKEKLRQALSNILQLGFGLSPRTTDRNQYPALTRADLYSIKLWSKDAEL